MFRRTAMVLSLAALLAGTGVVYAQTVQGPTTPPQRGHGMERMKQRLGLTDDQANAIRAAFQRHRDEQMQTWKALHAAQRDLRQLALNGADAGTIAAKTAEVQQLHGQTIATRLKVLQEIGPVLTPEQRAKFAEARFHGGRGRHGKRAIQS
jgi:Spy/CpxP family protein refolding chaperone